MGVTTLVDIDYGHIFGSFPVALTSMDPTYAIGMLTQDQVHQGSMIEVDPSINNGMARGMEWLSYINPARNEDEQNMEAYMKNKEVFYRALRIIKSGEELLVWYSKDFCQLIDIPDVKRIPPTENDKYICSSCGETFEYIFPLKAHMKFKCEIRSKKYSMNKLSLMKEEHPDIIKNRKRSNEDTRNISSKMFKRDTDHGMEISKSDFRDVNANVPYVDSDKTVIKSSAFRKVEKDNSKTNEDEKVLHSQTLLTGQSESKFENERYSIPPYVSIPMSPKECYVPPNMLSPLMMSSNVLPNSMDIRTKVMDAYGIGLSYPFTVRDSMIGNMESLSPDSSKQYLMNRVLSSSIPFTKSANPMVEKILQTSNPSMLHKPLPVLTQSTNWCAKCNTSFRMTSDLVYHMRSHHSKETLPSVKKRDDKLKCMICHETFKERHHLTRHMTSHQ